MVVLWGFIIKDIDIKNKKSIIVYRNYLKGKKMADYYHVSSLVKTGDNLVHETKNNIGYCDLASKQDVSTYEKFENYYKYLCGINILKETGRTAAKWGCETIFEYVRKTYFQHLPSRIWGIYLNVSKEQARQFLNNERKTSIDQQGNIRKAYIFKVHVPEGSKVCSFNMDIYTEADRMLAQNELSEGIYIYLIKKAKEYWGKEGTAEGTVEYLVDCCVTIGEKIL